MQVGHGMLVAANVETARHSDDVVVISRAICDLLDIRGTERQDLLAAARLHDIGKVAVPQEMLDKPGKLTQEEWDLMRTHTEVGQQILGSVSELEDIAMLVRHSHERWDGRGYPDGLSGDDIPLGSRIIFCADAFHAIRSDRPYRDGRPATYALAELRNNAGSQFDPEIVAALAKVARELRLVPAGGRIRRSSRLTALLLVLALGGGGSAIAHSGLLGTPTASASPPAPNTHSTLCAFGDCPTLGTSFFDQLRLGEGAPGASDGVRSKPFAPNGQSQAGTPGIVDGPNGKSEDPTPDHSADPAGPPSDPGSQGDERGQGDEHGQGGGSGGGQGNGNGNGGQGGPSGGGNSGGNGSGNGNSGGSSSGNPHGGAPGQTGNNPGQGGGGPPGQSSGTQSTGAPGNSGNNPHGGPPGQS
jgi:hypothetical protein